MTVSRAFTHFLAIANAAESHHRARLIRHDVKMNARKPGYVGAYGQSLLDDCLNRESSSIWQSDEVSRRKPTPQMEAERSTLVIETVLWNSVPSFLRKLNVTMKSELGPEYSLPLDAAPIKFASWMGGTFEALR